MPGIYVQPISVAVSQNRRQTMGTPVSAASLIDDGVSHVSYEK